VLYLAISQFAEARSLVKELNKLIKASADENIKRASTGDAEAGIQLNDLEGERSNIAGAATTSTRAPVPGEVLTAQNGNPGKSEPATRAKNRVRSDDKTVGDSVSRHKFAIHIAHKQFTN